MHVVIFHTLHVDWLPERLLRPITWGSSSTSLLFVLSGFVLAYTYAGQDGTIRIGRREFLWRRISRLVPLTLLAHLITVPLVWHAYPLAERLPRAIVTLLSLQAWFPHYAVSFNSPGWSVSAMLFWYALFPGMLILVRRWETRRLLAAMAVVWVAAMLPVTAYLVWGAGDPHWYSAVNHHPLARLPEFAFGVLVARLMREGWHPSPRLLPIGLAGWLAAVVLLPGWAYLLAHNGLLAPLHALVVLGIAGGGGTVGRILRWTPLVKAGESGFAIFLLHVPIYSWTILRIAPWLSTQPAALRWTVYLGYLVVTVLLSWIAERWISRFATKRLRSLSGTGSARAELAAVIPPA
jgi:peptidoglycan/LPS O-acetylase OafA/YrhL